MYEVDFDSAKIIARDFVDEHYLPMYILVSQLEFYQEDIDYKSRKFYP